MATCKDCLHCKLCVAVDCDYDYGKATTMEKFCRYFEDKSRFAEVVRCSECKYFGKDLGQGKHSCLNYQLPYCLESDYCFYGERRSDNENT